MCTLPYLHEPKELTVCFPVVKLLGFMYNPYPIYW